MVSLLRFVALEIFFLLRAHLSFPSQPQPTHFSAPHPQPQRRLLSKPQERRYFYSPILFGCHQRCEINRSNCENWIMLTSTGLQVCSTTPNLRPFGQKSLQRDHLGGQLLLDSRFETCVMLSTRPRSAHTLLLLHQTSKLTAQSGIFGPTIVSNISSRPPRTILTRHSRRRCSVSWA
jgi:hypothetical protein